jgi:hypothetical protein
MTMKRLRAQVYLMRLLSDYHVVYVLTVAESQLCMQALTSLYNCSCLIAPADQWPWRRCARRDLPGATLVRQVSSSCTRGAPFSMGANIMYV